MFPSVVRPSVVRPSVRCPPVNTYKVNQKVICWVVTSSIMHQLKEIPLLESLLNFKKDVFY